MVNVIRHDVITLKDDVSPQEFERFMVQELVPFFSRRFQGPTRISQAILNSQSMLRSTKTKRSYLWVTGWAGSPDLVQGRHFEHVLMIDVAEVKTMLDRLDSFGKRSTEKLFHLLHDVDLTQNS